MTNRAEQRREARSQPGSPMTKFYWVLGGIAVVGVAAVGYSVGSKTLGQAATEPVIVEGLDDMATLANVAQGVTKGNPDAPVTIMEFGDYQCPGCGSFALTIKPQVELTYIQSGKAKFIFYDFPLISIHPNAFLAARSARCALDQDKFWEYHETMYRNQSSWAPDADPSDKYVGYAGTLGMDQEVFEACVKSDQHADVVSANLALAETLGLPGTPAIMIGTSGGNPRRLTDFDFQSIQNVVESLLAPPDSTAAGG